MSAAEVRGALLLRGGTVVAMTGPEDVRRADVLVEEGRIVRVGSVPDPPAGTEVVDVSGRFVLPGFIQAHTHLGQALFRGLAEDLPLLPWLRMRIWPLEAAHDEVSARASARLGLADALASGTTTIQDMGLVRHTETLAEVCRDVGVRALLGPCLMDEGPEDLAQETDRVLAAAESFAQRSFGPRVQPILCPRFILSCSESLWRGVVEIASRRGLAVHTHLLEHPDEEPAVRAHHGMGQMACLDRWGVLDRDLRAAHCVQLSPDDRDVLGGRGLAVAHCPSANLKLGSGVADLGFLRGIDGVRVGLGCDGAPCNNDMDVLEEIRLAALLQKWRQGPERFSAYDALCLATCEGAAAVGLAAEVGTVEAGKRADLVVLDLDAVPTFGPAPVRVFDRIVYAAGRSSVRHVLIDGAFRVRDGRLVDLDPRAVMHEAAAALRDLLHRVRSPSP